MKVAGADRHDDVMPAWVWLAVLAVLFLVAAGMLGGSTYVGAIAPPLLVQCLTLSAIVFTLWRRRRGSVPWFEIGIVYSALVTLYGTYPMIKAVVVGEGYFEPVLDGRWSGLAPTMADVVSTGWLFALHGVAFAVVYVLLRGRLPTTTRTMVPPSTSVLLAVVAIYVAVQGFWIYVGLFYDTSAETYAESYLISQRLPLVLAQLVNHLNGMKYPISLVILAGLFANYERMRPYIVGWVTALTLLTFVRLGSRTDLALLLMAVGMMYHTLVRPLRPRTIAFGVSAGIGAFIMLGMLRGGLSGSRLNPFFYAAEFDVVFGNAIELARHVADGTLGPLPLALYLADIAALLPQQIAPFEKIDPAAWYVNRFYPVYAAQGGGMAFGTMAEAVLTGGWWGAMLRGAALGACFASIQRLWARRGDNYWVLVFYVWATTLCYQSVRGSTFYLLVLFAFRFLPVVIGVKALALLLERAAFSTRVERLGARPEALASGDGRAR